MVRVIGEGRINDDERVIPGYQHINDNESSYFIVYTRDFYLSITRQGEEPFMVNRTCECKSKKHRIVILPDKNIKEVDKKQCGMYSTTIA